MPAQKKAADFTIDKIRDSGGVALFCQQRSGKTYISCAVIEQLRLKRILIVAPLTSIDVVWTPKLATLGNVVGSPEELAGGAEGIMIIHYQAFAKIAKRLAKRFLSTFDIVILDESQGIKSRSSGQSRAARRFRDAKRRLILSGTPIDESPIDVWGQMRFVDHEVLGERWGDFANEYCVKGGFKNKQWLFNRRKMDQLLNVLKPHIYRLTVDFMNLKPVNLYPVPVLLLGQQEKIYDQMDKHSIVRFGNTIITGPLTVTKNVKLQQITGGGILTEDGEVFVTGTAKQRKLAHIIQKLVPPVVVFCQYLHEIDYIKQVITRWFHGRVAVLHGGVKDGRRGNHRTNLINDFQEGHYDALVCQLKTGGVSIELTKASNLVLYSINYSYIDFEQIIFRLRGLTQKNELNVYVLYAEKTIDEEKLDIIRDKGSTVWTIVSSFERG